MKNSAYSIGVSIGISQDLWGIFQMFRRAKFWISKVTLIFILEMMISFKLVGSNLVPLCRQSFSMAMANQLHLLFKRKTKPFNADLIQWDRKHLCFINASIWFSHWWSIVTFLLISRTGTLFKGRIMKIVKISQLDPDKQNNLVVINYHEQGLNKKNISQCVCFINYRTPTTTTCSGLETALEY